MPGVIAVAVSLAAALSSPAAAGAGDPPVAGTVIERVLRVGGKEVPLPDGSWLVAGSVPVSFPAAERVGAYGAIRNVVLFRLAGSVVDAALEVSANELPVDDGWGIAEDCLRTDLALAAVRYRTGWDGSCLFITHTLTRARGMPTAWEEATGRARADGLILTPEWLTVGVRVANRYDVLDARFHFSPATRGFAATAVASWSDSAWAASRLEQDPPRLAYARRLASWGLLVSGHVEAGIKGRYDAAMVLPMPMAGTTQLAPGATARRVAALGVLRESGELSPTQHEAQVARLLARGSEPRSETVEPAMVVLSKTLSYPPHAAFVGAVAELYWIGQPLAVGAIALVQATVATAGRFYVHELAWESVGGGGARREGVRTIDFRYFGTNR